jgi:squalene-associated FAD-dependent desaturase
VAELVAKSAAKSVAKSVRRVAVIGAGWAGCAAAVELAGQGHQVTLFEAARTLGGRARQVACNGRTLDNGQHILLGAYATTLRLLKRVGIDSRQAMLRLPLQMRYPPGSNGMTFVAPRLPAPLHLVGALLSSRGLARADKMSLARFSSTARWMGWRLNQDCSVAQLLQRWDQSARMVQLMWSPLCLAALNTPIERASANVFLKVLHDSLGARRAASDMLLPRVDLSTLFPGSAAAYITSRGGAVHTGAQVTRIETIADGRWRIEVGARGQGQAEGQIQDQDRRHPADGYDGVVLATTSRQAAALLGKIDARAPADPESMAQLNAQLNGLETEAITTCYLQYAETVRLDHPFFALIDAPDQDHWGQFVFDRGQLDGSANGLLAVVISASGACASLDQTQLAQAIAHQLAQAFARPELAQPSWVQVISEKRATFACTPGLVRPDNATGWPGLALAGDYTAGDYPATIEAAMRSGVQAASALWPKPGK